MTIDVAKRCTDMLKNFTERNRLTALIDHMFDKGVTVVRFEDESGCRRESYYIIWDEASNLSEACAAIYADLMNKWNLNSNGKTALNFDIKDVIFNPPATIILWEDGSKTVVKCQEGDAYSDEVGLALCIAKKALGNKGNFNNVFRKWVPEGEETTNVVIQTDGSCSISDILANTKDRLDKAGGFFVSNH